MVGIQFEVGTNKRNKLSEKFLSLHEPVSIESRSLSGVDSYLD
jgi:hypothetical protein